MDHGDWIRKEFKGLSDSLGFRYTPRGEIEDRLVRVKKAMEKTDIEGLLVLQKMNYYYLSGTTQDGALFLPLEEKPLLAVKREFERARLESPLEDVVTFKSSRELPALIQNHFGKKESNEISQACTSTSLYYGNVSCGLPVRAQSESIEPRRSLAFIGDCPWRHRDRILPSALGIR